MLAVGNMADTRQRYIRIEPGSVPSPSQPAPQGQGHDSSASHPRPDVAQNPTSVRQVDPEKSMHHGGSFGRYMELKNTKLQEQFEALQYQAAPASAIFSGVSIFVNGYTAPSHAELKQLMARHGGRFENYLYRDTVTHIICSNLPDTKVKQLAHERCAAKRQRKHLPCVVGWHLHRNRMHAARVARYTGNPFRSCAQSGS